MVNYIIELYFPFAFVNRIANRCARRFSSVWWRGNKSKAQISSLELIATNVNWETDMPNSLIFAATKYLRPFSSWIFFLLIYIVACRQLFIHVWQAGHSSVVFTFQHIMCHILSYYQLNYTWPLSIRKLHASTSIFSILFPGRGWNSFLP